MKRLQEAIKLFEGKNSIEVGDEVKENPGGPFGNKGKGVVSIVGQFHWNVLFNGEEFEYQGKEISLVNKNPYFPALNSLNNVMEKSWGEADLTLKTLEKKKNNLIAACKEFLNKVDN